MDRPWDALFADLEAQFDAQERLDLDAEVADRTRRERAAVGLHERLLAHRGSAVAVRVRTGLRFDGELLDVGEGWALLGPDRGGVLVRLAAVTAYWGLERRAVASAAARRFGLGHVLRGLARDRAALSIIDVDGGSVDGTIDGVGADHLDLAEHSLDEPPRRDNIRARRVIPFDAIVAVRR